MSNITDQLLPLADETTKLLKALAHPARLVICCKLKESELSVGEMETELGIKQPRLSRELGKLREEGLVESRRVSKVIFYRLSDDKRLKAMLEAVCSVMLGQPQSPPLNEPRTKQRKLKHGGYGVFARTNT